MPTALEIKDVDFAIQSALKFHQSHPYSILREFGAVADLVHRVRCSPSLRAPTKAQPEISLRGNGDRYAYSGVPLAVDRTQMEISVRSNQPKFKKSVDLVVLKDIPQLSFGAFGAGDVLEQIQIESIDIAIEVKTSQSSHDESRGNYLQDIYALLKLRELSLSKNAKDPAHGYFVLIDRNDPAYGQWIVKPKERMSWSANTEQSILFRSKGLRSLRIRGGLNECGIALSVTEPQHTKVWIKCFVLDSTGNTPSMLYAFKMNDAPPAPLRPYVNGDVMGDLDVTSE